jgi:amidase
MAKLVLNIERLLELLCYSAPFDMTGNPTITLPCGFTVAGLPLGFQFIIGQLAEDLAVSGVARLPAADRLAPTASAGRCHGRE